MVAEMVIRLVAEMVAARVVERAFLKVGEKVVETAAKLDEWTVD